MKEFTKELCLRHIEVMEADIRAFETAADIAVLPLARLDQYIVDSSQACRLSFLKDRLEGFSVDLVDQVRVCVIAYLKRLLQEAKKRLVEVEEREAEQQLYAEYCARVPSMSVLWAPLERPWAMRLPANDPRRFP